MVSVVYKIPDTEFAEIVQSSPNVSQVMERLGGGGAQTVKKRMKELGVELGKKNGHSSPKKAVSQQKRQKPRQQQSRRQQIRSSRRSTSSEGVPWPVLLALGGVAVVAFGVDYFARADAEDGSTLGPESPAIEELKEWINQIDSKNNERYQSASAAIDNLPQGNMPLLQAAELAERNQDAIQQLAVKKIPSLEDTKKILSEITTKSNEFQTVFNEAQAALNKTESRINNLESKIDAAVEKATEENVEITKSEGPDIGQRILGGVGGFFVGALGVQALGVLYTKITGSPIIKGAAVGDAPMSAIYTAGVVGAIWGGVFSGWPLF